MSTSNQTQLAKYTYSPFGEVLLKEGAFDSRYQFSSKEYDFITGLNYYGYRFYSPELGRWMSRDPIGEMGGYNQFLFSLNSPIDTYDILGLYPGEWIVDCYKRRNEAKDLMKKARENYYKEKKNFICCVDGDEVDMDSFLDPEDGNKTSHQILHMLMGCEMKEAGISKKCMILANLIYEGKTAWQEWIKRPDRDFEDWLRDTGYDVGAVVGGFESGGPCTVDRFHLSECVPKEDKPCGCGGEGDGGQ